MGGGVGGRLMMVGRGCSAVPVACPQSSREHSRSRDGLVPLARVGGSDAMRTNSFSRTTMYLSRRLPPMAAHRRTDTAAAEHHHQDH